MSDPEKVLMRGTARALALEPNRIMGGSTVEQLTLEDVGFAIAGMRARRIPPAVVQRVEAALQYVVLGDQAARWDLYRLLLQQGRRAIDKGRWPERVAGREYHDALATLAIYANEVRPLDLLLSGSESPVWLRELAPCYRELRESMREWVGIGMAHVRRRTAEEGADDGE